MIDFKLLVRNSLFEADASTTSASSESSEKKTANNIQEFLAAEDTALKALFAPFIANGYIFPSQSDLQFICYNALYCISRQTKDSDKFPNIENYYPLLDLIALLYTIAFKGNETPDQTKVTQAYVQFKDNYKNEKNSKIKKPIEYESVHPWPRTVKSDLLTASKNQLGEMRIETIFQSNKNASFYQLIKLLLEIRQNSISPILPNIFKKMAAMVADVQTIFLSPWNIVSGQYSLKDQRLKVIYDDTYVSNLVNLSLACYKLYTQQVHSRIEDNKESTNLLTNTEYYNKFMGINGAEDFIWPAKPTTNLVTSSFNHHYELLKKDLLKEEHQSFKTKNINKQMFREFTNNSTINPSTRSASSEPSVSTDQTIAAKRPFEKEDKTSIFIYDLSSLDKARKTYKLQEAVNLYQELVKLADYSKREQDSLLGNFAKTMASKITTMGYG